MKVCRITLTGLLTVIGLTAGLAVAAAPAVASPQRPTVAMRQAPTRPGGPAGLISDAAPVRAQHITLPSAECAALRRSLRRPAADCAGVEALHVSAIRAAASSTYYDGFLEACQSVLSNGYCNESTGDWFVFDYFNFTVSTSTDQVWHNSNAGCNYNDTNVQWCTWSGSNGTSSLSEGFNFDNNKDYARMYIYGNGTFSTGPNNSWENVCGGKLPSDEGFGCT
jgi:hypothetical protein